MNYYRKTFCMGMKNRKFFVSIIVIFLAMSFSLTAYIEEEIGYFFRHDYIITFLQGYNEDRTLITILAPLIATIPFATRHIENRKSGAMKYVVSRMGVKKYFNSIFLTNIVLSFVSFFIGMSLFLLVSFLLFDKNIDANIYNNVTNVSVYKEVAKISPTAYVFAIIIHCSFVSIAYSSVGLSLSYFLKSKFTAWVAPFVIATMASLFAMFVGLTKIEPMAIFDVSRVGGMSILFLFSYILFVVMIFYMISYKKFKKDMKNDEEI